MQSGNSKKNQNARFFTSVRREICYYRPDLARISDDHSQIPGQINIKVKALALSFVLVQVRRLHDYRWKVKRFVEHRLVAAFNSRQILMEC